MTDNEDEPTRIAPASEGVRILGAREASEFDAATASQTPKAPNESEVAEVVTEVGEQSGSASMWTGNGPSWSAADAGEVPEPTMALPIIGAEGEAPELPHWSEPPTGQIPSVFQGENNDDPGQDTGWSNVGPSYRSSSDDWSDDDFARALAGTDDQRDEIRLGAMAEPVADVTDDDAAFVAAVRARRRAGTRAVVTSTPERREARPPRAGAPQRRGSESVADRSATSDLSGDVLPASTGRNMPQAIITAAVFAAVALVCFYIGAGATAVLVAAVLGVCAFELCTALQSKGLRPATVPVVAATAIVPILALHGPTVTAKNFANGYAPFMMVFGLLTVTCMLWYLFKAGPGRAVVGIATSVKTFAYIGGLGGYAGLLLQRGDVGVRLILGTLLCVIAYDVLGLVVGSKFGNAKIAPEVSPHKTVEGTLGGVLGAAIVAMALVHNIGPWNHVSYKEIAVAGFLIGVAALLGDLCESMIKRDLGIKDIGTILPGHGGFLDRFDGLIFALPVAFYLTAHFGLFA